MMQHENRMIFSTERLPLAIFLHADGRLNFLRCEPVGPGQLQFIFDDPNRIGDAVELEFENGASVIANAIFASQKFLRRRMSLALDAQTKTGKETARHGLTLQ
jgi:hypothetical protein